MPVLIYKPIMELPKFSELDTILEDHEVLAHNEAIEEALSGDDTNFCTETVNATEEAL